MNKRIICYQIRITEDEYQQWHNELLINRPLTPEIAGMLIGRATPIFTQDKEEKKTAKEEAPTNTWQDQMQSIGH